MDVLNMDIQGCIAEHIPPQSIGKCCLISRHWLRHLRSAYFAKVEVTLSVQLLPGRGQTVEKATDYVVQLINSPYSTLPEHARFVSIVGPERDIHSDVWYTLSGIRKSPTMGENYEYVSSVIIPALSRIRNLKQLELWAINWNPLDESARENLTSLQNVDTLRLFDIDHIFLHNLLDSSTSNPLVHNLSCISFDIAESASISQGSDLPFSLDSIQDLKTLEIGSFYQYDGRLNQNLWLANLVRSIKSTHFSRLELVIVVYRGLEPEEYIPQLQVNFAHTETALLERAQVPQLQLTFEQTPPDYWSEGEARKVEKDAQEGLDRIFKKGKLIVKCLP